MRSASATGPSIESTGEAAERCDFCAASLAGEHQHLFEPATRRILCGCEACLILLGDQAGGRFRAIKKRAEMLGGFQITDALWRELASSIELSFFTMSTGTGAVHCFCPSPFGAIEADVSPQAWDTLLAANPVLRELVPDVEALLVNRVGREREYYRVSIDECYRLAGTLRTVWQGISGGPAIRQEIGKFFDGLKQRTARSRVG